MAISGDWLCVDRYRPYRELLIALRTFGVTYTIGSMERVPNNEEFRAEMVRNPQLVFMHWLMGMPIMHLIAILGLKARPLQNF